MAKNIQINYTSRDFESIRIDLINFIKAFFPDQWQDFNISSPGMALLELNAYVSDLLNYAIDKKYNELFLDGAKERRSVYRLAKTFGYKAPGVRPAMTIVDFTIEVPATANGPDESYLPVYRSGVQVKGLSQIFETTSDINFSSDFSEDGKENRKIEPILNANQDLIRYRIVKREIVKAGSTKILKREMGPEDSIPFFELILPETNVLEIVSLIIKPQLGLTKNPTFSEFNDFNNRYFEVEELPDDKIFINNDSEPTVNGISVGRYTEVEKRFSKEFLSDGRCKLTFGGGVEDYSAFETFISNMTSMSNNSLNMGDVLNNTALGVIVPANSTMFIKYRVGGGISSNLGSNTIQEVSNINAVILGSDQSISQRVISSTKANNPIPAIGGKGIPSEEEVLKNIAANFSSQKRCVTLEDYITRCYQMPGKFGTPFRIYGKVEDNKVKLYILTIDSNGVLRDFSTNTIKNNIAAFLVPYRMFNDFVEINDGKIINIQVEADLFIDNSFNGSEVKSMAIDVIKNFLSVSKKQMNENIYISQIVDELREVPGVINVVDLRFFNMESGGYSNTLTSQAITDRIQIYDTGGFRTKIEPIDNAIFGTPVSMFEIKYPEKDIFIRVASGSLNFIDGGVGNIS